MDKEDSIIIEEQTSSEQNTDDTPTEINNESVPETKPETVPTENETVVSPKETKSKPNKKLSIKDKKARAIEAFNRGESDPDYRVIKMKNGKYRTYLRSAEDAKINNEQHPQKQKQEVKPLKDEPVEPKPKAHSEPKQHNPFNDIVYYNMNNQFNEQLSKRLDEVNNEINRLKQKNSKLKCKYKQLKQVIYLTDDEDEEAPEQVEHVQSEQQAVQPEQQAVVQPEPVSRQRRRTTGIDFIRYFV